MSVYCISFPSCCHLSAAQYCMLYLLHVLPCHTHLYSHSILTAVGYYADLQYHSLHTAKLSQRHCEPIGWTRVTMARTREEKHFSKHQSVQLQLFFPCFCIPALMIQLSLLFSPFLHFVCDNYLLIWTCILHTSRMFFFSMQAGAELLTDTDVCSRLLTPTSTKLVYRLFLWVDQY